MRALVRPGRTLRIPARRLLVPCAPRAQASLNQRMPGPRQPAASSPHSGVFLLLFFVFLFFLAPRLFRVASRRRHRPHPRRSRTRPARTPAPPAPAPAHSNSHPHTHTHTRSRPPLAHRSPPGHVRCSSARCASCAPSCRLLGLRAPLPSTDAATPPCAPASSFPRPTPPAALPCPALPCPALPCPALSAAPCLLLLPSVALLWFCFVLFCFVLLGVAVLF